MLRKSVHLMGLVQIMYYFSDGINQNEKITAAHNKPINNLLNQLKLICVDGSTLWKNTYGYSENY